MIADAKVDLFLNYTLKDNQAYANLSVDVLETTKGYVNGNITEVNLDVVVSADVIEYYQLYNNKFFLTKSTLLTLVQKYS
ncbi:hypothetical protein PQZ52_01080 [Flavobacteriales bacterium]|nr:hypothetical protein [Flavobacteriales bacterium]